MVYHFGGQTVADIPGSESKPIQRLLRIDGETTTRDGKRTKGNKQTDLRRTHTLYANKPAQLLKRIGPIPLNDPSETSMS